MKSLFSSAIPLASVLGLTLLAGVNAQGQRLAPATARLSHNKVGMRRIPTVAMGGSLRAPRAFAKLNTATADAPTLYGIICDRQGDWTVSSFPAAPGITLHEEFKDENLYASGGAVYAQGKLYVNYYYEKNYEPYVDQYVYNANDWSLKEVRNMHYDLPTANVMAYDEVTGQVFMQQIEEFETNISWYLATMNLTSGESRGIAYMPEEEGLVAMAFDKEGVLYGVNLSGMFEIIDTKTAKVTKIGHTDLKPAETMQSAVIDPVSGKFYWAAYTDEDASALYEIDVTTGHATLVSHFPVDSSLPCLYIPTVEGAADAPAMAQDLQFSFEGPSLTGQLSFTTPSVTQAGAALTKAFTAHVTCAGKAYDLEVEPGKTYSIDVTVKKQGYIMGTVSLRNEAGRSLLAEVEKWVGPDYPVAPGNIKLEQIEGTTQVQLTWERPTIGIHGGYVNPDEVTYFIYGNEPRTVGTTWIESYSDTIYIKDVPGVSKTLYYQLRASYKELNGDIGISNYLYVGSGLTTPCTISFANAETFSHCTLVDADQDGKTWSLSPLGYAICTSNPADDWIITQSINIQAGKRYKISVNASARNGLVYPCDLEVYMGKAATVEAMTDKLGAFTIDTWNQAVTDTYLVSVTESAEYYFAVHDVSDGHYETRLYYLDIEEEAAFVAPDEVTNLTITPGENGTLTATLSFTAPVKDVNGAELTSIDRIEIKRGYDVIGFIDQPAPGQQCTYVDENAKQGNNKYTIAAINAEGGRGAEVVQTVYCGEDIPGLATNVQLCTEGNFVRLTWEAPVTGLNGGYINPENVVYTILDTDYGNELEEVKGQTHFEWTFDPEAEGQYGLDFAVATSNVAGGSEYAAISNLIVMGRPYQLPIYEDFRWGMSSHAWFASGRADWNMSQGSDDDGYLRFYTTYPADGRLVSGKINLQGCDDPRLNFSMLGYGKADSLVIEVIDDFNSEDYQRVAAFCLDTFPAKELVNIDVPLAAYTHLPYVHVILHGYGTHTDANIVVDDIRFMDVKSCDLAIGTLLADKDEVTVGEAPAKLKVDVVNHGTTALTEGDYTVDIYADSRLVTSISGVALGYFQSHTFEAEYAASVKDANRVKLYAVVNCNADQDTADNTSNVIDAYVFKPYRPAVNDLSGVRNGDDVVLSWSQPDQSGQPVSTVFDDFEDYRPFQINHFGDWTLIDVDQCPVVTTQWLFYPDQYEPMAFDIFNTDEIGYHGGTLADKWPAHSGKQFAMCMGSAFVDNDDWMITPELSGLAQTISFWANSVSVEDGHEMIRIYYSTTGKETTDFVEITSDIIYVPNAWTEYSFDVPAGAKYFAVRCVSHNRMALQIDDFTYQQRAKPLVVSLIGYNVYCNGELLNETPVAKTEYTVSYDATAEYVVCAVYDLGESDPSNILTADAVGIEAITAPAAPVQYYDLFGRRVKNVQAGQMLIKK